ncbi:MAG: hypothetical protein LUG86_01385 [Oscillospiraceae bacterium]|nr:hypothetical protein [Oscillospiraceae bacterium]
MKLEYAARVDIGIKETNDDRVLVGGNILDMTSCEGETSLPALAVVCDGCGGYAGGGIAAYTVLEFLSYEEPGSLGDADYLSEVLENCNRAVFEKKEEMPSYKEMCTTVAGCVFLENSIVIFHSGDSRVYRCDRWGLAKMTVDHTVVREMVDMGQLTEEEAADNPHRNIITRCMGADCLPPEIYVVNSPMAVGEKYLLCSDGLWDSVGAARIKEILKSDMSLEEMADKLVDDALTLGSEDNISVCICAAREDDAPESEAADTETDTEQENSEDGDETQDGFNY